MFKKPRRHFRQRNTDGDGSDEDSENQDDSPSIQSQNVNQNTQSKGNQNTFGILNAKAKAKPKLKIPKSNSNKSTKPSSGAPISFELDEEDEGEIFQVKKSSQSRKLIKRLKKESKQDASAKKNGESMSYSPQRDEVSIVLNGDRALDMDLDSDCETDKAEGSEGGAEKPQHSFKSLLERGVIPDANLIHLARKKRAQAREQGDFIPLDDTKKVDSTPKSTQRLVRDDDNDMSDEEDRIDFTVNSLQRDKQHMKDTFMAAEHGSGSDSDHDRDWEQQQISKVVGGREPQPQVSGNADYTSYYSMGQADPSQMVSDYSQSGESMPSYQSMEAKPLPDTINIDQVKRSLVERLSNLQIVHRVHTQERDNVQTGLLQSKQSTAELENKGPDSVLSKLNAKYTFMQQVRSYVRDLLGCFNEKYTRICELDFAVMSLAKRRSATLCKRRQDDIKDEASDSSTINKITPTQTEMPVQKRQQAIKARRVADREARRTRRRQLRQANRTATGPKETHHDGMSSDDEESKSDIIKYQTDRDKLISESQSLFEDVIEDFSTVSEILERFEEWKRKYTDDYNDAYVGLCLPKLLSPLIKLSLISWNPLEVNCKPISEMSWFRSVAMFGHTGSTYTASDPDDQLIPMIVEKVLIPKLTGYVDMVWDPVSKTQTHNLATLLHGLVDTYPTLNTSSKNTATLLKSISLRINVSLDEDTFMPLFANDLLLKSVEARSFLHRQIWSNIKLYQNILQFSCLLSDSKLRHLALDSLLNRYIMLGLQCAGPDGCLKRIKAVTDALPSHWLKTPDGEKALPELENLCRFIRSCAKAFHQSNNRDELKGLLRVLVSIHAHDHATWMSEEFSLRMPK